MYNKWCEDDVEYIMGPYRDGGAIAAAAEAGERVVILSHHAPTQVGTTFVDPDEPAHMWQQAINCEGNLMFDWPNVAAWCFGHTHFNSRRLVRNPDTGDVKWIVSNQAGCADFVDNPHFQGNIPFDPSFVLELP